MQLYNRIRFLLLATFLLPAMGALAQADFTGSDVLVNTTTANSQQHPAAAMDSSGNYVVVWESEGEDGDGWGIYAQLYLANGTANGSAFKINSTTTGDQRFPDVAMRADGEFCVAWQSYGQDSEGWGCYRRCYDSGGVAQTSESRINNTQTGHQRQPKVAMSADGFIAWTWMSENVDGDGYAVMTRVTNNSYANLNAEAVVNSTTTGYQGYPDVAIANDNSYVIVWQSENQDGDGMGIYGQAYDASYTVSGSEFLVNTTISDNQQEPAIGMDSAGNYIVVWADLSVDSTTYNIFAQRYTPGGTDGSAFQVNTSTGTGNDHPRVAMTKEGSQLVVWENYGGDGSFTGTYGQVYNSSKNTYGSEITINTRTTDFQQSAAPSAYADSVLWVVAWQDGLRNSTSTNDGDDYGVYHKQAVISDTTAPTAVCKNLTLYLDGAGTAGINAIDLDGGSTDNSGDPSFSASMTNFVCGDIGVNSVTLTVSDGGGNFDNCTSSVTVLDTTAPTVVCQNITVYLDGTGNATVTASDVDGGSSDNCSIDSQSLSQTSFSCSDIGTVTPTLTLADPSANTSTCSPTVTVVDSSGPTANCQNLTVYLDGSGSATVNGSDADAGSTDNCTSPSFSLSQTSFTCSDIGANAETLTVTDGGSNSSTCSTTITVVDSTAPTASCQNISVYLDGSGNASITTGDIDNGSTDNCAVSSSSLDVSTFICPDVGTNTVTLSLSDASSNSATCTSTVTVVDSTAPTAACQNISVYLDATGNATISSSDIDNGSSDNCSVGTTIDISSFTCSDVGANTVTLTADDASSNSATCTSTVTVVDSTAPTAVCQNTTVYLAGFGAVTLSAATIDDGSADNCSVTTYTLDVVTLTCIDIGPNTVNLTVEDASSNSATCTSTVTVADSTAPTASCQSISVFLDGSGNASITTGDIDNGSTDNCAISSSSLDVSAFTCANVGSNTVTFTAADASNNSATCTSTVTVVDSTPPTAACQNISLYLDPSGNVLISASDIDNGSSDNCSVSTTIAVSSFSCSDVGPNTVTLTASDASSNSATCTSTVTVVDSTAPTAACQNITVILDGGGNATITTGDIDNGSADACGISSLSLSASAFTCADVGANTVILTAVDASTNSATCSATVTVLDSVPPTASCQSVSVYLDGSGNGSITTGDIDNGSTDNCAIASSSLDVSAFTCTDIGSNTVTLTTTDGSNNSATCSATVTVIDSTAPAALCQNISVYLDGSGNASITTNDVDNGSSDNCSIGSSSIDMSAFACADVGANTVTLTLTDGSTNSSSCTSVVTVIDSIAPTAVCQNISVYLDASGSASIVPADVTASTNDNCAVTSSSLDISTFVCADIGANTVSLTAIDAASNSGGCQAIVTVLDSIAPNAVCTADTVYLDATGTASLATSDIDNGSTDNCSNPTLSLNTTSFNCTDIGINLLTLTVADASGNTDSCMATVLVFDTLSPTTLCQAVTVYLDGNGDGSITLSDVGGGTTDNCTLDSLFINNANFSCADVGTNTVTLTAIDVSGNSSTCAASVTVSDTIAPMVICLSDTVYLGTNGQVTITPASLDGGSSDACGIASLTLSQTVFTGSNIGVNSVTLTATDVNGNMASCISDVTVLDTLMSGIEDGLAGASFLMDVYPNPTYDDLNVKVVCEDCWNVDGITLRLVNVTGQVVLQRSIEMTAGEYSTRIDLSKLAAGPYMLSLERDGERITRRVVKF